VFIVSIIPYFLIETPKRHILGWFNAFWALMRADPFRGFCCSSPLPPDEKGTLAYKKSQTGYISPTGWPKKWHSFWYTLTSSNINRFSKLFHFQNQEKMCNNTFTKYPTTPQVCRYTTLWNVKWLSNYNWKQDDFCNNTFLKKLTRNNRPNSTKIGV